MRSAIARVDTLSFIDSSSALRPYSHDSFLLRPRVTSAELAVEPVAEARPLLRLGSVLDWALQKPLMVEQEPKALCTIPELTSFHQPSPSC